LEWNDFKGKALFKLVKGGQNVVVFVRARAE